MRRSLTYYIYYTLHYTYTLFAYVGYLDIHSSCFAYPRKPLFVFVVNPDQLDMGDEYPDLAGLSEVEAGFVIEAPAPTSDHSMLYIAITAVIGLVLLVITAVIGLVLLVAISSSLWLVHKAYKLKGSVSTTASPTSARLIPASPGGSSVANQGHGHCACAVDKPRRGTETRPPISPPQTPIYANLRPSRGRNHSVGYSMDVEASTTAPTQVNPTQVGQTQAGLTQVAPTQVASTQVNPTQVDPTQVAPTQVNPTKVDLPQVNPTQVGPAQVNPTKVDLIQVNPTQVGPAQVDLLLAVERLHIPRPSVCVRGDRTSWTVINSLTNRLFGCQTVPHHHAETFST